MFWLCSAWRWGEERVEEWLIVLCYSVETLLWCGVGVAWRGVALVWCWCGVGVASRE